MSDRITAKDCAAVIGKFGAIGAAAGTLLVVLALIGQAQKDKEEAERLRPRWTDANRWEH